MGKTDENKYDLVIVTVAVLSACTTPARSLVGAGMLEVAAVLACQ